MASLLSSTMSDPVSNTNPTCADNVAERREEYFIPKNKNSVSNLHPQRSAHFSFACVTGRPGKPHITAGASDTSGLMASWLVNSVCACCKTTARMMGVLEVLVRRWLGRYVDHLLARTLCIGLRPAECARQCSPEDPRLRTSQRSEVHRTRLVSPTLYLMFRPCPITSQAEVCPYPPVRRESPIAVNTRLQ